jgi:hypothetical protein
MRAWFIQGAAIVVVNAALAIISYLDGATAASPFFTLYAGFAFGLMLGRR